MGRPPTPVGTHGAVRVSELAPGHNRARTRFRDYDGRVRLIEAWGSSAAAATRALNVSLRDRATPTGLEVGPEMRLSVLGGLWFDELELEGRLRKQSVDSYRLVWNKHVEPALGQLRVREATVSRVERAIRAIAEARPGQVKHARVVLAGVLGMAVRHDAITANPVRSIARSLTTRKAVVSLDLDQLEAVRRAVRDYRTTRDANGHAPSGPRPSRDLADVVDVLLATGARPGEVLALRWSDVDLTTAPATVTICGTVTAVKGAGLARQPMAKTDAGHRSLPIPAFAVAVLLRRQVEAPAKNAIDAVFPSRAGTWKSPRNVARSFRAARAEAGLDRIVLKSFRPTVATLLARELDSTRAAEQLGHTSDLVTKAYYIAPAAHAPDSTAVLDQLGPRNVCDG
jgi:integrase